MLKYAYIFYFRVAFFGIWRTPMGRHALWMLSAIPKWPFGSDAEPMHSVIQHSLKADQSLGHAVCR